MKLWKVTMDAGNHNLYAHPAGHAEAATYGENGTTATHIGAFVWLTAFVRAATPDAAKAAATQLWRERYNWHRTTHTTPLHDDGYPVEEMGG